MIEGTSHINRPVAGNRGRALALAGLALAVAAAIFIFSDPLGGSAKPSDEVSDNSAPTSLATVTQRSLSSQLQVVGTLGYADASSIRLPGGPHPPPWLRPADPCSLARKCSPGKAKPRRRSCGGRGTALVAVRGARRAGCLERQAGPRERDHAARRRTRRARAARRGLASARTALSAARASATL